MHYETPGAPGAVVRSVHPIAGGTVIALLASDGSVRFHDADDLTRNVSRFVLHNAADGGVASITESFDRSRLITAGPDGNVFLLISAVGGNTASKFSLPLSLSLSLSCSLFLLRLYLLLLLLLLPLLLCFLSLSLSLSLSLLPLLISCLYSLTLTTERSLHDEEDPS